jgi:hypothetical protein
MQRGGGCDVFEESSARKTLPHFEITICDFKCDPSDAHGHDDVAVAVGFVGEGAELAGGLFVL